MNVLIADIDKVPLDTLYGFVERAAEVMNDDIVVLPKGIDVLQDVPIGWLKDIRDRLDEKIRELENSTLYCPLCGANYQDLIEKVMYRGKVYRCTQCGHSWEV